MARKTVKVEEILREGYYFYSKAKEYHEKWYAMLDDENNVDWNTGEYTEKASKQLKIYEAMVNDYNSKYMAIRTFILTIISEKDWDMFLDGYEEGCKEGNLQKCIDIYNSCR